MIQGEADGAQLRDVVARVNQSARNVAAGSSKTREANSFDEKATVRRMA